MNRILIHAWIVYKADGQYYIPYTHWVYLKEIEHHASAICLLSPVNHNKAEIEEKRLFPLSEFKNLNVYELPYRGETYASAARFFLNYYRGYQKLYKSYNKVYVRYPVPFGWICKLFYKSTDRTVHFVGYPLDVTRNNPDFSCLKKFFLIALFTPEHKLYIQACRGARVFTNGHHIKDFLLEQGIKAQAVTSSTLIESDFYLDENKVIDAKRPKLIHVGHLRKWKNIDVIVKATRLIIDQLPGATLTIVGDGETRKPLESLAIELGIADNVTFAGHAASRAELVSQLRSHDVFLFSSVSEGSPRVIVEAMANGINVVSTPVGSLPFVFEDDTEILFADFDNPQQFCDKTLSLIKEADKARSIRVRAFAKAKGFTIKEFIKLIFGGM